MGPDAAEAISVDLDHETPSVEAQDHSSDKIGRIS
jgi:hypothetical protein